MKKFVTEKNQWLLERYPLIWNTKVVWVVAISAILHVIFYVSGIFSMMDPEVFQQYNTLDLFFNTGAVFFGMILSILILLIRLSSFNAFSTSTSPDIKRD